MFENIIEQGAVLQLRDDLLSGKNAPSMLFFGPYNAGKGSAALELARFFSCEENAAWKCSCPSCEQHRYLRHDDLLILGPRSFIAEITACKSAFLRNPSSQSAKLLFFRSLRKLIIRFSPVLMEDDPKLSKINPVLQSLDEKLDNLWSTAGSQESVLEKLCGSLVKDAVILENEGIGNAIPVGKIRHAAYWCRLAPNGKRKTLIIENAENMRDEGRNSLLKLLEEPPVTVSIVLTAQRREVIIPTILSRLRQYRFLKRSIESEKEVIRRVFQDKEREKTMEAEGSLISAYLESFLPQGTEKLYPLAAWFIASLARMASISVRKKNKKIPAVINALGERYAPIADAAGFTRCLKSIEIVKTVISKSENFENNSFPRFMKICLEMICAVTRTADNSEFIAYNDIFKKYINEAVTSVEILNINAAITLEALLYKLKTAINRGQYG